VVIRSARLCFGHLGVNVKYKLEAGARENWDGFRWRNQGVYGWLLIIRNGLSLGMHEGVDGWDGQICIL
jgi:hypothetical protein